MRINCVNVIGKGRLLIRGLHNKQYDAMRVQAAAMLRGDKPSACVVRVQEQRRQVTIISCLRGAI